MTRPTVVFDTNVLVTELGFPDEPERCVPLAESGTVEAAVSPALVREFAAVLDYDRLPLAADRRERAVERVAAFRTVTPAISVDAAADLDDDAVLECALAAAADVIVSDDAHLLELDGIAGVQVRTRETFLARRLHRNPEGRPSRSDAR